MHVVRGAFRCRKGSPYGRLGSAHASRWKFLRLGEALLQLPQEHLALLGMLSPSLSPRTTKQQFLMKF